MLFSLLDMHHTLVNTRNKKLTPEEQGYVIGIINKIKETKIN
jgi:hypothetical protein